MTTPLVSVCMITYNHAPYIRQAVESVLMQKTDFPVELVIGDDASTDGTSEILRELATVNSDVIRLTVNNTNLGMSRNFLDTLSRCKGKYIALLEGDDFWTVPDKLRRQAELLESNNAYGCCSHRHHLQVETGPERRGDEADRYFDDSPQGIELELKNVYGYPFVQTLTLMFRRDLLRVEALGKYRLLRDTHVFYHLFSAGKGFCLNFFGGVYRVHSAGVHSGRTPIQQAQNAYDVYTELYKSTGDNYMRLRASRALYILIGLVAGAHRDRSQSHLLSNLIIEHLRLSMSPVLLLKNLYRVAVARIC